MTNLEWCHQSCVIKKILKKIIITNYDPVNKYIVWECIARGLKLSQTPIAKRNTFKRIDRSMSFRSQPLSRNNCSTETRATTRPPHTRHRLSPLFTRPLCVPVTLANPANPRLFPRGRLLFNLLRVRGMDFTRHSLGSLWLSFKILRVICNNST